MFPTTFDGIQVAFIKGLSYNFFDSHSPLIVATCQIGARISVVDTNQNGLRKFSPLLMGALNAGEIVNLEPWDNVKIKLQTRVINYLIRIHCFKKIYIFMYCCSQ